MTTLTPAEINRRIELAQAHLAEIINSNTFRAAIEETEKVNTLEAYWELSAKLSRELFAHLERYKGNSGAHAYSVRLDEILNGIDIDEVEEEADQVEVDNNDQGTEIADNQQTE